MGKVKRKPLRELYYRTQKISLPTKPSEFQMEEKSRRSNACATRCSTGMHFEQLSSIAGGRTDFTNKASEGKRASQCPSTDNFLFSHSLGQCTSSEASKICSVSTSIDSSFENSEGQARFRDSCEPGGQSGYSPKGLINFDNKRFPNQLEKRNEYEFLGDNISCISKSDCTNLAIGNQNNDAEKKNVSSSLASVDSLPAVENDVNDGLVCLSLADSHFHKSNSSHCGIQNFTKEPPPAGVSLPNRSGQSDISSIKDIYDSTISLERVHSECSDEQVDSSLARAAAHGLSGQIEGVCNHVSFGKADHQLNSEDPAIETESHSYCERHLQKSVAVMGNNNIQEPWQSKPVGRAGLSDFMDDGARVCDICGDVGREHLLAICSKCSDGAEHIYCMRVKLEKVPEGDWACEECLLMTDGGKPTQDTLKEAVRISKGCPECQKSSSSEHHESRSCDRFSSRSSGSGRRETNSPSFTSQLSAKRPASTLEVQSMKKARVVGKSPVSPMSSKICTPTLLCEDFSCKNLKKGKMEAATYITSMPQFSTTPQEIAGIPSACGYKRDLGSLEAEFQRRVLDTRVVSLRASNKIKHSLQSREPPFKNLEDEKIEDTGNVTYLKRSSNGTQGKTELPAILGNANATGSKVHPRKDPQPDALKKFSHAKELKTAKGNDTSELRDPAICLPVSDSGVTVIEIEKETISCEQPVISVPNCHKLNLVKSCGKQDYRLKLTSRIMHEDLKCPNEDEMNESWQSECLAEATTETRIGKLCSDFVPNELPKLRNLSQFDTTITSAANAIPEDCYIWRGKFQIHSNEGLANSCDGIQSHLSTKASPKVLEVVDRFAEVLLLEELPRLSTWPSQFMERPVTEDDIALYFFAKDHHSHRTSYTRLLNYMKDNDLALRGNFDGVELLIFPSNVLPENSESWNRLSYLWGVFRGQVVGTSANATGPNSRRVWNCNKSSCLEHKVNINENRDSGRRWKLDLNVYPQDEEDTGSVHDGSRCLDIHRGFSENDELDSTGTTYPGVGTLLGGDGCSSALSDQRQAHPYVGENYSKAEVADLELSLWSQNAMPGEKEVDTELSQALKCSALGNGA